MDNSSAPARGRTGERAQNPTPAHENGSITGEGPSRESTEQNRPANYTTAARQAEATAEISECGAAGINPQNQHNPPPGHLALTRITARSPAILVKSYALDGSGTLVKTSAGQLADGIAEQVAVADLADFSTLIDGLTVAQALTFGVADGHPTARVVSEKRLKDTPNAITRTRRFFGFRRAPGVWMLDHDAGDGRGMDPSDLITTLRSLAPCLADCPLLWRVSSSSGIVGPDGTTLQGLRGQRLYIPVADAGLIPDAGKALVALLWAGGHGRIDIGKAGQALERTLVDASVWQPERLDFAAPPKLGPGLSRNHPPPRLEGNPAGLLDLCALIAAADGSVQNRASTARRAARDAAKPALATARDTWIDTSAPELAEAHGIDVDAVKVALRRASEKQELTGDFVLTAADGSAPRVGELLDNPAKWHGKRFADPLEPDYTDDARIAWANLRSGRRPYIYSHAHGGRRFYLIRPSARIELSRGQRARVVDQTLDLLRSRGELYDFGTGSSLARVTDDARALPVARDWLSDHLDRVIEYFVLEPAEDPLKPPVEIPADAPQWAASRILAKDGDRGMSLLDAVITAPTLRADGSILADPGYDAPSRLLLLADSPDLAPPPSAPTLAQAKAALNTLWHPFRLFPLVDAVDCGVVLQALLTATVRASLPTAPGVAFDAPTAGTGKTLLAQAIGALSLGYCPPALPPAGNQDDETRKRLFAALRDGHRVLLWDNVREPLGNASLDAFMTAPTFTDRILGVSQMATLPNRALFIATGNSLRLVGDTCRRILPARLDARTEKPYAREFGFCPLDAVLTRRAELVTAALTIMRAWITAGRVRHGKGRSASFEAWDDLVRQSVCWVATWDDRFSDPLTATDRAFALDPETAKLAALLSAWQAVIGGKAVTTAKLIDHSAASEFAPDDDAAPALRDAIAEIADERGQLNRRILGRWIERHVERRHDGLRLVRGTLSRGSPTWILTKDEPPAPESGGFGGFGGFKTDDRDLGARVERVEV
ncbi:hypothetical protein [uncultured Lamprocystis sp.]|jgi:hypothetical protein|uniref:hypothetical protein n=1 Tax=uncultured Lamprocystis sp. TaxID=543132 RepID=UPI0025CC2EB7|nr:hypothetical protein [uncultured Lamprocystis sp.]